MKIPECLNGNLLILFHTLLRSSTIRDTVTRKRHDHS